MRPGVLFLAVCGLVALARPAAAHQGPPYPVLVDKPVGPYTLTLWADPDVGTGSFFVGFDPPAYKSEEDPRLSVEVWPSTGRLEPVRTEGRRQRDKSYLLLSKFDREEMWTVKLRVEGSAGVGETVFEIPVTPPGYGQWDLLIYLSPFLLIGGFWALVAFKRRKLLAEAAQA